jgi:hypothetical protein
MSAIASDGDDVPDVGRGRTLAFQRAIGRQTARSRNGGHSAFFPCRRCRHSSRGKKASVRRPPLRFGRQRCRSVPLAV